MIQALETQSGASPPHTSDSEAAHSQEMRTTFPFRRMGIGPQPDQPSPGKNSATYPCDASNRKAELQLFALTIIVNPDRAYRDSVIFTFNDAGELRVLLIQEMVAILGATQTIIDAMMRGEDARVACHTEHAAERFPGFSSR